ncbi:GAF sensor signal transduction histidine kinase [Calothrix sp. NIES-4071]|nr:GAF sensor signal transduction histidine kinase [Calothrix sp. NIES-4071]BAZ61453.1 GAF sensor signal transduction histidine kinase [Calothrix sp. NIES-4105]
MNSNNANVKSNSADTILVVDDYPSNLQVLFALLENYGFRVLAVQNGENALKIAESILPDLILLDILMPGMDGFEVCRLLKAKASTQDIPVIFLTALSETVNIVKGFELGGIDYVTKPIEHQELLARIQTHLTLKKMRYSLAVQNEELQQEISARERIERQQALVRRLTEKIRDSLDETQILQTVTEELVKVLKTDSCLIELYDEKLAMATIVYEYKNTCQSSFLGMVQELTTPIYQQLLQKIPSQFVDVSPEFSFEMQFTKLACPIFDNGTSSRILGNIWLFRPSEAVFEELEVELVQQVASQCAIAIRQARLYEASQQQVEELEKLNRLKDDFLKTISHELRSPMTSMQLAMQTLEKLIHSEYPYYKSPKFTRVLEIFTNSAKRHNRLVENLLMLCYLDVKSETLTSEIINLQILISEILQSFEPSIQHQQQHLVVDLPLCLPLLSSHAATLERILVELLTNACKYTPAGETIALQAAFTDKVIEISVINSGIVIPQKEQHRIFDQFYRIPNNDPWQHGGSGLGLTLVKKMVEVLGASLELESKAGQTKFTIKLQRGIL